MAKAWKIAPGSQARAWDLCRETGCIVIGWRELGDYREFDSKGAVQKALKRAYRGNREIGKGPRAAQTVWSFAKEVQREDLVIANYGRRTVVGIGVIKSDYLPPGSPEIPAKHEWLTSARLVDWRVKEPVQLRKWFFVQDTVWPLDPADCGEIKDAYRRRYPALRKTLDELFSGLERHINLDDPDTQTVFAGESDIEGLRSEYRATRASRSRRLRNKALQLANGVCAVCHRDFGKFLRGKGKRLLQVHHREQLSARVVPSVTKVSELAVVCANCHLLLHLDARKAMTIGQLRRLLASEGYLEN